jgi:hypothetical protein
VRKVSVQQILENLKADGLQNLLLVMNESPDEVIRKGIAFILIEVLTTSKGQNVFFESNQISPTQVFTLNKVPSSVLELLQKNPETLQELKSLEMREGFHFCTFPAHSSSQSVKSLSQEILNFPDPHLHLFCIEVCHQTNSKIPLYLK